MNIDQIRVAVKVKSNQKYLYFWFKFEIRSTKSETNSNDEISKFKTFLFGSFGFWTLVLVSDFVLRISNLEIHLFQY
jgi:hypothetical protein